MSREAYGRLSNNVWESWLAQLLKTEARLKQFWVLVAIPIEASV